MNATLGKLIPPTKPEKGRVFVDTDVLIAGAAPPFEHSASLVILGMAELTLIKTIPSSQVLTECDRNLQGKSPRALPAFQLIANRSLQVVADPKTDELVAYKDRLKDLSLLIAAAREGCPWLTTFNLRGFQPGISTVTVLEPRDQLLRNRNVLASLGSTHPGS